MSLKRDASHFNEMTTHANFLCAAEATRGFVPIAQILYYYYFFNCKENCV